MRLLRGFVVATLCLGVTPGLGELLSDGMHLVAEGHTSHEEGHAAPDSEHGCTGWQHTCGCCVSMTVAPAVPVMVTPLTVPNDVMVAPTPPESGAVGVRKQLERPPRA